MSVTVKLESLDTKSRFVTNAYLDEQNNPKLIGSELPMPTADIVALRTFEGRTFAIGAARDFDDKLPAGQSLDLAVAWAEGVVPRVTVEGLTGGDAIGYLYEGATVSGGTSVTATNLNRPSTRLSESAALLQPTVSSTGTLLLKQILTGGVGKKAGGAGNATGRLYLKPLTTYLFRITNKDSNNTAHATEIILEWYE
jgi:hypothetical protein